MQNSNFLAVMALFDGDLREEIFLLLDLANIKNYTHFVNLHGSSDHGKKENNVSWPGSNEILLLLLNQNQYSDFTNAVRKYKSERSSPPPLLIFNWGLQELL